MTEDSTDPHNFSNMQCHGRVKPGSQYDALPCVAEASRVAFICEHCASCKRLDALTHRTATQELKKV